MVEVPNEITDKFDIVLETNNVTDICDDVVSGFSPVETLKHWLRPFSFQLNHNIWLSVKNDLQEVCNDISCDMNTNLNCEDDLSEEEEKTNIVRRDTMMMQKKSNRKRKKIKVNLQVRAKNKKNKKRRLDKVGDRIRNIESLNGHKVSTIYFEESRIVCPAGCIINRRKKCGK